jgi:hypothetical protein
VVVVVDPSVVVVVDPSVVVVVVVVDVVVVVVASPQIATSAAVATRPKNVLKTPAMMSSCGCPSGFTK